MFLFHSHELVMTIVDHFLQLQRTLRTTCISPPIYYVYEYFIFHFSCIKYNSLNWACHEIIIIIVYEQMKLYMLKTNFKY